MFPVSGFFIVVIGLFFYRQSPILIRPQRVMLDRVRETGISMTAEARTIKLIFFIL